MKEGPEQVKKAQEGIGIEKVKHSKHKEGDQEKEKHRNEVG